MFFMRSVRVSCSCLRAAVSSWRSWMRYFWPNDLTLRSKIPVMAANWMKLCLCFIAFAMNPIGFLGFGTPGAELDGAEEAMAATLRDCLVLGGWDENKTKMREGFHVAIGESHSLQIENFNYSPKKKKANLLISSKYHMSHVYLSSRSVLHLLWA